MDKINPRSTDKEYWEKILQDEGLGMGRGKRNWLSYRGDIHKTLEAEEGAKSGKVKPGGHGPD